MNKLLLLVFFSFLLVSFASVGQSDKEKAQQLMFEAIEFMENGKIKESISLLEKAQKLDPQNIDYPYEIALAHYIDGNYKTAIKQFEKLAKRNDVIDRVYQALGNSYSMSGQPKKAIATYEKGLNIFPNSGILYLERGNMELFIKEYGNALSYYEKGIEVDPKFPSNYYWASKIYCSSTEEVWGMIYGELFMNLERNSKRTAEISKLLYDTYKSEIVIDSDTSFSVSFSKNATIEISDPANPGDFKLPFGLAAYESTLMMAAIGVKSVDLSSLDDIRTKFVEFYFDRGVNADYPNVLFDYQKRLLDAGHLEAYNHWILMKGDEDTFISWKESSGEKWEDFVKWFTANPIRLSSSDKFYRGQY